MHLGMIVEFEMQNGSRIEGRLLAVEDGHVHLGRTRHSKLDLHDIKQVVTPPPG